jgi:hypothetical protein
LGQRSRKRRTGRRAGTKGSDPFRDTGGGHGVRPNGPDPFAGNERLARGYARGRERDAAARAALKPLAPGERPLAVTVGAVLAALLGTANVVLLAAGWEVEGSGQSAAGVLIFAGLMWIAAAGMWRCRYWAVLGFEVLLGIAIVYASMALLVASNLAAVLRCLGIVAIAAPLFWFLIRAMARIQLPSRQPREPVG